MSHGKVICKKCKRTISQCRCIEGCKNITYDICTECKLENGDKDWDTPCEVCGQKPTVHPTELCGPCCFGEAETIGGNW